MKKKIGFQVFAETDLIDHIIANKKHYSHCISIRDPEDKQSVTIESGFKEVLELKFYDIESIEYQPKGYDINRVTLAEYKDIIKIYDFFERTIRDKSLTGYTIHCRRGISRSAAVALGLIYLVIKNELQAVKYLLKIRPEAMPLPRILRFWDQILDSNLSESGEWMRYNALNNMRKILDDKNNTKSSQLSFEEFKVIMKKLEEKERDFFKNT